MHRLDVPGFLCVLADSAVGGEVAGGSDVYERLAAKGQNVACVVNRREPFVRVVKQLKKDKIVIRSVPTFVVP